MNKLPDHRAIRTRRAMLVATLAMAGFVGAAHAQVNDGSIARTYTISDSVQPAAGDLISLDRARQTLHLSRVAGDRTLFGVIVDNPVMILQTVGADTPIVTSGEAQVNVTTAGGPIVPGDFITSSSFPGKGKRASSKDAFIVGIALAAFAATTSVATGTPVVGTIPVLVGIGPYPEDLTASTSKLMSTTTASSTKGSLYPSLGVPAFMRYLLAAVVVIGSVAIAFRNFSASIRNSIISVGRNPLAKSSIQAMVTLNMFLIALVSAAGLFIGFAILFLPM